MKRGNTINWAQTTSKRWPALPSDAEHAEPAQWSLKWQHSPRIHENQNGEGQASKPGTFQHQEPPR